MASRKVGVLLTALALTASVATTAFAATVPGAVYSEGRGSSLPVSKVAENLTKAGITDIKADHFAAGPISVIVEAGLIQPDTQGNIKPDAPIPADSGIAVFAKVLGVASKTDDPATAAKKAQEAGIASSNVDTSKPLSRLETARMLAKALGIEPKVTTELPFKDAGSLSAEDRGILAALKDLGIFKGFPDGTFGVDGVLTTAQLAILVDRILGAQ